jgi:hypothetical protein
MDCDVKKHHVSITIPRREYRMLKALLRASYAGWLPIYAKRKALERYYYKQLGKQDGGR